MRNKLELITDVYLQLCKYAQEAQVIPEAVQSHLDRVENVWDAFLESSKTDITTPEQYDDILDKFDNLQAEILQTIGLISSQYPELVHLEKQLRETFKEAAEEKETLDEEIGALHEFSNMSMSSGGSEEQQLQAYENFKEKQRARQRKAWDKKLPIERREIRRRQYEAARARLALLPPELQQEIRQKETERKKPKTIEQKRKRQKLEQSDKRKSLKREHKRQRDMEARLKKLKSFLS